MKSLAGLLILTTFSVCAAEPGAPKDPCAFANTQLEINRCTGGSEKRTGAELAQFIVEYRKRLSPSQVRIFNNAETAWEAFRVSACKFEASGAEGGTAYPMVYSSCMAVKTQQRLTDLKRISQCKEGDLSCPAHM